MPLPPAAHDAVVTHRGSFAHASCGTCGWVGAGRRSVGRAQLDAEAHLLLGPSAEEASVSTVDLRTLAEAPTDS